MKVITRHLTAQILRATGLVLLALLGLFFFFDLVSQADKIGIRYSFAQAFAITAFDVPERLYEIMPIAVLLGAVYTMSRWAANSEFTILRTAGLSFWRFFQALLVPGLIFVAFTYLLSEIVAPVSTQLREEVHVQITNRAVRPRGFDTGVWARDQVYDKSRRLVLSRYVNVENLKSREARVANGWHVYEFSPNNELRRVIEAPVGNYAEGRGWELRNAVVTEIPSLAGATPTSIPAKVKRYTERTLVLDTNIQPQILSVIVSTKPDQMPAYALGAYIEHLKANHEETGKYEVAFWKKVFYPLSIFVMLALSMPFAYLSSRAGGVSLKIFVGLMIGIAFFALNSLFSYLGILSSYPPILTGITPILVALMLAVAAMWRVERR